MQQKRPSRTAIASKPFGALAAALLGEALDKSVGAAKLSTRAPPKPGEYMTPISNAWARYWRASIIDGQGINPDWSKCDGTAEGAGTGMAAVGRQDWESGQLKDKRLLELLFKGLPDEADCAAITAFPRVYSRRVSHCAKIMDGNPAKFHTLVVKASVDRKGRLTLAGEKEATPPSFNRTVLWPTAAEGRTFFVGEIDALDDFLSRNPCPSEWRRLISYCAQMESAVLDASKLETYEPFEPVMIKRGVDAPDFAAALIQLYDIALLENPACALFDSISEGVPTAGRSPREMDTCGVRRGHMHPENALAPAQRQALGAAMKLSDGQALAVNGPPGTGKTTLLQSVVASCWIAPIVGPQAYPNPPVIVACSTNNQAVTNIIESFQSVPTAEGSPLADRWIDWASFGAYLVNERKAADCPYPTGAGLAAFEAAALDDLLAVEANFVRRHNAAFPKKPAASAADCADRLRNLIRTKAALLEELPAALEGLERAKANCASLGADPQKALDEAKEQFAAAKTEATRARSAETAWLSAVAAESPLRRLIDWIPFVAASKDLKAQVFLRENGHPAIAFQKGLCKLAPGILASAAEAAELCFQAAEKHCSAVQAKVSDWTSAARKWEAAAASAGIAPETETFEALDMACDCALRQPIFMLATHYWEGRWIGSMGALLDECRRLAKKLSPEKAKDAKWRKISGKRQESYLRKALICPVFVSTFHSLPGNFSQFIRKDDGSFEAAPHWNFIDLLIVDEAGQVSPEIGAAGFLLAKKAFVVGDALQIEPVWGVPKAIDRGNALAHGLDVGRRAEDLDAAAAESDPAVSAEALCASSGSLIRVAGRSSPFNNDLRLGRGMHLYEHRRCDDSIIEFCNRLCYQGTLIPKRGTARRPNPSAIHLPALGYARIPGKEERPSAGSLCNKIEASAIAKWIGDNRKELEAFYQGKAIHEIVAVVTPYKAQSLAIAAALRSEGIEEPVTVGTVHSLQGAERPVVLFSPTNSRHAKNKKFFWNEQPNLLNVAVSRAKDSFLVFSDMSMFDPAQGTPAGLLAEMMFADPGNEMSIDLASAVKESLGALSRDVAVSSVNTLEGHREILRKAFDPECGARNEIVVTSPWITESALDFDNVAALAKQAVARGVRVRIYTDQDFNMGSPEKHAGFVRAVGALRAAGAEVIVVSLVHSKVLYADDRWKCVGSFNWLSAQRSGRYVRHEVSTFIEGSEFVSKDKDDELGILDSLAVARDTAPPRA